MWRDWIHQTLFLLNLFFSETVSRVTIFLRTENSLERERAYFFGNRKFHLRGSKASNFIFVKFNFLGWWKFCLKSFPKLFFLGWWDVEGLDTSDFIFVKFIFFGDGFESDHFFENRKFSRERAGLFFWEQKISSKGIESI